jgi:predicted Zn-dependent protease
MKLRTLGFLFLFVSLSALAQVQHSEEEVVQHFCKASKVTEGPEFEALRPVRQKLGEIVKAIPGETIKLVVVDSEEINARTFFLKPHLSLICIPVGIIRFMGSSEGELAFVLAHETGHALDDACKTSNGRAQIANPTLLGGLNRLFGGAGRDYLAESRQCESRADAIGLDLIVRAGYNPYDAAGSFGRLEMYSGDISTSVLSRFRALASDHPMTPDRIRNMRGLLEQYPQP